MSAFDITTWMKPVPSRTIRKWIFPLERRLCSQPAQGDVLAVELGDVLDVGNGRHQTFHYESQLIYQLTVEAAAASPR